MEWVDIKKTLLKIIPPAGEVFPINAVLRGMEWAITVSHEKLAENVGQVSWLFSADISVEEGGRLETAIMLYTFSYEGGLANLRFVDFRHGYSTSENGVSPRGDWILSSSDRPIHSSPVKGMVLRKDTASKISLGECLNAFATDLRDLLDQNYPSEGLSLDL